MVPIISVSALKAAIWCRTKGKTFLFFAEKYWFIPKNISWIFWLITDMGGECLWIDGLFSAWYTEHLPGGHKRLYFRRMGHYGWQCTSEENNNSSKIARHVDNYRKKSSLSILYFFFFHSDTFKQYFFCYAADSYFVAELFFFRFFLSTAVPFYETYRATSQNE